MSNSTNLNSIKSSGLEIVNDLSTSGTLNFCDGYLFLGESYQDNVNEEINTLPPKSYMGTSETRGNVSRDIYNINTNGPIQFGATEDDKNQIVKKYSNIVLTNPVLTSFPWLYPPKENWTSETQVALGYSKKFPIYKCLGKGLGEIEFYKVASSKQGQPQKAGNTVQYSAKGITCGNRQDNNHEIIYPFNGKIYAGTLVQLITETDETTGLKETKVIPYQQGRGIPQYADMYQPSGERLTDYAPFGELQWPSTQETISPSLAQGIDPNDSNKCVGIVLDTFSTTIPDNRMFKYKEPNNFTKTQLQEDPHDPWYNHPAPFTVPAVSVKNTETTPYTQGFLSPGPNLSGGYWAPWPDYYAYQPGDPIPVLTKGITTARIGAAYNIALTSYGVKKQISATDESWVPIVCIPLFQGERLEAGSYIYSSVKGMIMTPGAETTEPRGPGTEAPVGMIGQTPWDFFVDSTWGNIGWCGTPGLSFTNIPDSTTSIMEILKDPQGARKAIPFINQANQGSIIVHPLSNVQPEPALGNAYLQKERNNIIENLTEQEKQQIYINRFNIPGVSGRCMLPQPAPEKCQPIGVVLETIIGQGKWTYTNLPVTLYEEVINLQQGGVSYFQQTDPPTAIPVRGGSGTLMEAEWSTYNELFPFLGTITSVPTISVAGSGYVDGDIVTLQDNTIVYNSNGPQYKGNNAAFTFESNALNFTSGGSNYGTLEGSTFNASRNNVYFQFTVDISGNISPTNVNITSHFQNYALYFSGIAMEVLETGLLTQQRQPYNVVTVDESQILLGPIGGTSTYAGPKTGQIMETNVINYNFRNPIVEYEETSGSVTSITKIVDYGAGNTKGDLIILTNPSSDNNAIFAYPGIPPGYQEISHSSSNYPDPVLPYNTYIGGTTTTDGFTVNIFQNDLTRLESQNESLPIVVRQAGGTSPALDTIYQVYGLQAYLALPVQSVPSPQYIARRLTLWNTAAGDLKIHAGGTGYTSAKNVKCYNLTANSLTMNYNVAGGQILTDYDNRWYTMGFTTYGNFPKERFVFDPVNGTEFRLLDDTIPEENQQIRKLISLDTTLPSDNIVSSVVQTGIPYKNLTDGLWNFNIQRTDQVNPTVDIEIRTDTNNTYPSGTVGYVKLKTAGTGNNEGDLILVTQEGSDQNCVFIYNNNMPYINLPPYASREGYNVDSTDEAWEKYSDIMASSLNLMDKEVLVELRPTTSSTMETIYPVAQNSSIFTPSTNNQYEAFY